jgi:putative endonuclease
MFAKLLERGWGRNHRGSFGQRGERLAAQLLRQRGLKILERHLTSPAGEIDIVAVDGDTIVFVEVKTRQSSDIREALEAVDSKKQAQLTRLALAYLKRNKWLERPARFDVVGIAWPPHGKPIIKHVDNAFEPVGRGQMFS